MSTARKAMFPTPHHMTQSEASEYLRRQVLEDALAAGWLVPCARKAGGKGGTVFFRFSDVNDVSLRIAAGEYPFPDPEAVAAKRSHKKKGGLAAV